MNTVNELFKKINWKLLRSQKRALVDLTVPGAVVKKKHIDAANGLVNLLDSIQDTAVDDIGITSMEVFGKNYPSFKKKINIEGSKHTPGEWVADGCAVDSNQFEICVMSTNAKDEDGNIISWAECEANAKLIASAPALLEENKRLRKELEDVNSMYQAALGMEVIKEKRYNRIREALKGLVDNIALGKLKIKKDFSLINAHAFASKVLHERKDTVIPTDQNKITTRGGRDNY